MPTSQRPVQPPPPHFLSLPQELRNMIYTLVLTTSTPLVVSLDTGELSLPPHLTQRRAQLKEHRATTTQLGQAWTNLLQCHSVIASEAGTICYGQNTFLFSGPWTWDTVDQWLTTIGPRNRGYLTRLEVTMDRPLQAWQEANGERVSAPCNPEPPFPRSRHLPRRSTCRSEGMVESLDPAIEKVIDRLRRDRSPDMPGVTIQVLLVSGLLPGFQIETDEMAPYSDYFSLDLPNLIEKVSTLPLDAQGGEVTVLWEAQINEREFRKQERAVQEVWEILTAVPEDKPRPLRRDGSARPPWKRIRLVFRKKPLLEEIWAAGPSPYSGYRL